ncbi:MAG: type IX secretion system membrane protein PorP/SprF [Bacteroidota bacterium]
MRLVVISILAVFILSVFIIRPTKAQEVNYTLNQFSPLSFSPASSALNDEVGISFLTQQHIIGPGTNVSINALNAIFPIIQKKSDYQYLGIGASFQQQDFGASDLLKTNRVGIAVATKIQISKSNLLGFGIAANYINKRTSLENLTTGNQWIQEEFRFDPLADPGEIFIRQNISYLSIASGIKWKWLDSGQEKAFASLNAFHLNKPTESFFQNDVKVETAYLLNLGFTLFANEKWELIPEIVYAKYGFKNEYQIIGSIRYYFDNANPYDFIQPGSIQFLMNHSFSNNIGFGFIWHQTNFKIGGSYLLPIVPNSSLQNTFQLGVHIVIKHPEEETKVIKSEPIRRKIDLSKP